MINISRLLTYNKFSLKINSTVTSQNLYIKINFLKFVEKQQNLDKVTGGESNIHLFNK